MKALLLAGLLASVSGAAAQTPASLDSAIAALMRQHRVPGVARNNFV